MTQKQSQISEAAIILTHYQKWRLDHIGEVARVSVSDRNKAMYIVRKNCQIKGFAKMHDWLIGFHDEHFEPKEVTRLINEAITQLCSIHNQSQQASAKANT